MWPKLLLFLLLPASIVLIGTLGYHYIDQWPWLDALFMSVITISTVGYGIQGELSANGKLFTIFLIFLSLGTVTYCVYALSEFFFAGTVHRLYNELWVEKRTQKLQNHFIICGYGRKGLAICKSLQNNQIAFVVIDNQPHNTEQLRKKRYLHLVGTPSDEELLNKAQIHRAKGLIALLPQDAENVFLVLTARGMKPELTILAWCSDDNIEKKLRIAGATEVYSPFELGGKQITRAILKPQVCDFMQKALNLEHEQIQLEQIHVAPRSHFIGKSLRALKIGRDYGVLIVAVRRGAEKIFNPPADTVFQEQDILIALGSWNQLNRLKESVRT